MSTAAYTPATTNVLSVLNDHLPDEIMSVRAQIADYEAKRQDRLDYLDVLVNVARAAGIQMDDRTREVAA